MKINKLLLTVSLLATCSFAQEDVMQKSMSLMEEGMTKIQKGFLHNSSELIKEGSQLVNKGNTLFSKEDVIKKYLPADKKHMTNVAVNTAERIKLDLNVLNLNLDDKAYVNASSAYSDILNACSRCHAIVRNW